MSSSSQQSWWFTSWFSGWSWPERVIVPAVWLVPLLTLCLGGRNWGWVAGIFALLAFALLQMVVWRHGGWKLLGPHFYYDVIRLARRGQSNRFRVAYLLALLGGLFYVYQTTPFHHAWRANDFAQVSETFAFVLFLVQNIAILILTPAYVASAITEEKERRTLELLFTTQLSNVEIVLGILFARIIHLAGFVLAGFPILTLIQFWGGIDMVLLVGNLINTLLNIITIGSICLLASTFTKTVTSGVMVSYAMILPVCTCCMASLHGSPFVLHDSRAGGVTHCLTVQDLGPVFIVHVVITMMCLSLAVVALRDNDPLVPVALAAPPRQRPAVPPAQGKPPPTVAASSVTTKPEVMVKLPQKLPAAPVLPKPVREPERLDMLSVPYTLPPLSDNALLWKERFLGGPALAFSPVLLVPMIPFLATGVLLLAIWFVRALFFDRADFQRSLEMWSAVLRFFYYVFLGCYTISITFRLTSSIARERQQQTLEPLLLLPIERREILYAKWLGALWRSWPWLALALGDILLGVLVGAYHPYSAVLLSLAPWPLILFLANFGLLLSVTMQSVLRANVTMVLMLVAMFGCTAITHFGHGPLLYMDVFAYSAWLPARGEEQGRVLFACILIVLYLAGAAGCWRVAQVLFERPQQEK